MKITKIIFIALFVAMGAILSAPIWGGCDINFQLCKVWCDVRHMNNSFDKVACKGSCSTDKLSCLAK